MDTTVYPIINKTLKLPFIVYGIGSQSNQCHINRPNGQALHQIIFCTKGKGLLKINQMVYEINEGSFFYLKPNEAHEYYNITDWATDWISFDGENISTTLAELNINQVQAIPSPYSAQAKHFFHEILIRLQHQTTDKDHLASSYLYRLLIELYQYRQSLDSAHPKSSTSLTAIISYIETHYNHDLTLEQLASIENITPQHLCKLFKKQLGVRPFEYIRQKRMQAAKKLLITTNISIKQISVQVGYHDCGYFCSQFKKQEHISPNEFRGNSHV